MKQRLTNNITAIFTIVYIVLFALCAWGQEQALSPVTTFTATPVPVVPKSTLPDRLPTLLDEVRDWAVTNSAMSPMSGFQLTYVSKITGKRNGWESPSTVRVFQSYQDYENCLITNCVRLLDKIRVDSDIGPDSDIQLYAPVDFEHRPVSLIIKTNLGANSLITSNSFINLSQTMVHSVIHVPKLERFEIQGTGIDGSPEPYQFVWNKGVSLSSRKVSKLADLTTTDLVVINQTFLFASNSTIRFTITAGGQTETYTHFGDPISKPRVHAYGKKIGLALPRGAVLTDYNGIVLESSLDNIYWFEKMIFTSVNDLIPIDTRQSQEIFRIRVNLR